MCGITGKIYFDKSRKVSREELGSMTDVIEHRGPDDQGHYLNDNVGLGFRRLSIIDLKAGHQPLANQDETLWITFNGEIYNFKELRSDLIKKGYQFSTNSDTEVIVNLYQEYGEHCVQHLRGMFAFVIWDTKKQELFGARDRFGIKPFHFYLDNEKFVWASEIKSILKSSNINNKIDLNALDYYFTYGYSSRSQSVYSEIEKLEPGHSFVFKPYADKKMYIKSYWNITFTPDYSKSEEYWKEAIYESLNEAVKMRLVSDVPLGAFLSGGVDSSIVVGLMSLNSPDPVKTFSIGFKEEKYNELKYAKLIADKFKTDHHEFIIEPESVDLLPQLVASYDEPFADPSAIPTYYVSKYTRQHVTVALSGDGGDELFAGYNSYDKMDSLYKKRYYPKSVFAMINKMMPDHMFGKGMSYYLSKNKQDIGVYFGIWKDYERMQAYHPDIKKQITKNYSEKVKLKLLAESSGDFIGRMQQLDMKTFLVDDILTKVDRASMMNSLEARVPILDHKFAELSFKIPTALKRKGNVKKYILKEAFRNTLPAENLSNRKQGFATPLDAWFKGDLKEFMNDTLLGSQKLDQFINKKYLEKIVSNHQKGQRDYSEKIWSLLVFNEWLNQNHH